MPRAEERGFSLIEVLVAFTIAALLLVVILRGLTLDLAGAARTDAYTAATLLAESTLDALGVVTPLAPGTAETRDGRFRIAASVERYHDPAGVGGDGQYVVLYRVAAAVFWRESGRERSVSLWTLRLGPPS
jgi:general secretion pathway protein I